MSSEINRCPNCGTENGALSKFCNGCGQPLPQKVTRPTHCSGCGALLPLTGKFCNECGRKIEGEQPTVKEPIHYRCSKCGNIKTAVVAFCEECGGSVEPIYEEGTTVNQSTKFSENLKGIINNKKPNASILFGKRKGETKAQGKKKQWWIIVLVIVLISGMAGGIGTAISEGGAGNRKAEDFISAFEKAGYTMRYDADLADEMMESISDYEHAIEVCSAYYTSGSEKVNGRMVESEAGFYYIKCNTDETAAIVYDILTGEMDDVEEYAGNVVKSSENKEKKEYTFGEFYDGQYYAARNVVSRNKNIVVCLGVSFRDTATISSCDSVLFKKLGNLGF